MLLYGHVRYILLSWSTVNCSYYFFLLCGMEYYFVFFVVVVLPLRNVIQTMNVNHYWVWGLFSVKIHLGSRILSSVVLFQQHSLKKKKEA